MNKQSVIKYIANGNLGVGTISLIHNEDNNTFRLTRVIPMDSYGASDVFTEWTVSNPEISEVIEVKGVDTSYIEEWREERKLLTRIHKRFTPYEFSQAFSFKSIEYVYNTHCNIGDEVYYQNRFHKLEGEGWLTVKIVRLFEDSRFGVILHDVRNLQCEYLDEAYGLDLHIVKSVSKTEGTKYIGVEGTTYPLSTEDKSILKETCKSEVIKERFHQIYPQLERELRGISSSNVIHNHPLYQEIISMGSQVIPLILEHLESFQWFAALSAITGKDPVPDEYKGHTQIMIYYWRKELDAR